MLASAATGWSGAAAPTGAPAAEFEHNVWPVVVRRTDPGTGTTFQNSAGPFVFSQVAPTGEITAGVRPFWYHTRATDGDFRSGFFLYPLFSYTASEEQYQWSLFELVRRWGRRPGAPAPRSIFEQREEFEVFPIWFSRTSGDPDRDYRGLFPIYGTVRHKLGFERLSWTLFPLYVENESRGAVTTSTPWPIVRVTRGTAEGFGIWPLFQRIERPGVSREAYYLWPLGYKVTRLPSLDDPPGTAPRRDVGALPFYARSTGPGYVNVSYGWPFFGYTHRTAPARYDEVRYFWPFLVQGRGEGRYVNRWSPFYSHSLVKGYEKKWYAWPLLRLARWEEEGLLRSRTQFLYFVYLHQRQESIARPNAAAAELTHVWPLWSGWDNGAGRRQWQLFSPLEPLFPGNEKIRTAWSPLFALARHDQRAPGHTRTSLLWDAITWEERAAEERKEFHLGPLLSVAEQRGEKRIAVGNGLFGIKRTPTGGWRPFWREYPGRERAGGKPCP